MRTRHLIWTACTIAAALIQPVSASAQVYNPYVNSYYDERIENPYMGLGVARNPYTGYTEARAAAYNPYTGAAMRKELPTIPTPAPRWREGAAYNPYTGVAARGEAYHNPYTGVNAEAETSAILTPAPWSILPLPIIRTPAETCPINRSTTLTPTRWAAQRSIATPSRGTWASTSVFAGAKWK